MKHSILALAILLPLFTLAACAQKDAPVDAAPATQPTAAPSPYDWQPLFNGQDLGQWKVTDFGAHAEARVRDGNLIIPAGAVLSGVTWTGDFPTINYEISLEANRLSGSDFFCGLTFPVRDSHASLIIGGWGGGLVGISSLDGNDAANNPYSKYMNFEQNRWYTIRLRVEENRIQAWIDGQQEIDVDTTDMRIDTRPDIDPAKPLGLSTYQTTAALRNIRYRRTP